MNSYFLMFKHRSTSISFTIGTARMKMERVLGLTIYKVPKFKCIVKSKWAVKVVVFFLSENAYGNMQLFHWQ